MLARTRFKIIKRKITRELFKNNKPRKNQKRRCTAIMLFMGIPPQAGLLIVLVLLIYFIVLRVLVN